MKKNFWFWTLNLYSSPVVSLTASSGNFIALNLSHGDKKSTKNHKALMQLHALRASAVKKTNNKENLYNNILCSRLIH